jgi:hypothetical protein
VRCAPAVAARRPLTRLCSIIAIEAVNFEGSCRGCNAFLGRIENNASRHGLRGEQLVKFLLGGAAYLDLHRVNVIGLVHPTWFSPDGCHWPGTPRAYMAMITLSSTAVKQ